MSVTILQGDCRDVLKGLPDESVQCVVTSPPYWGLRDYGCEGQIGLEDTPDEYVAKLRLMFREVRRVLKKDGTCWINLGDTYSNDGKWGGESGGKQGYLDEENRTGGKRVKRRTGLKPKDLIGIPWRVAFALQGDGWWLRQDIIWHKPNPMPESVTDRCTKSHEYLFLLTKSDRYYFNNEAIKEPVAESQVGRVRVDVVGGTSHQERGQHSKGGTYRSNQDEPNNLRNKRSVWTVATAPYSEAHFATFPPDLITPCILAGSRPGDTVLDLFGGSGTTGMVALELGRKAILIELNPDYVELIHQRTHVTPGLAL